MSPDILDALVAYLRTEPTILSLVGGRVWQGVPGNAEDLPYLLVIDPLAETTADLDTRNGYLRRGSYDLNAYVEDPGDGSSSADDFARTIARQAGEALTDVGLEFGAGKLVYLRPDHHLHAEIDPDLGPHGRAVWHARTSVSYLVAGTYGVS